MVSPACQLARLETSKTAFFFLSFSPFLSSLFFNFIFIVDTITEVAISYPLAHSHPAPTPLPSGHPRTAVCVCGSCVLVLWLIPSSSFIQSPSPLTAVSLFHVSMSLSILPPSLPSFLPSLLPSFSSVLVLTSTSNQ